ncbi:hypothetical protein [Sporosarcina ureilytica]|uniref:Uncharacterized protein n=1 Tax=Sporosarcina ureilytica TaxID=298596 RepID=A0A1D8JEG8_9BACL|nr:hypothetical protein [Sporosarcina ureilytica]AOV07096.1 hypothetical protein BI350_05750 [Sporosarcina ureilytica]
MGLFMNLDKNPKIFKNDDELIEPNQDIYRQDDIAEMMIAQQRANDRLYKSLQEIENTYKKQSSIQARRIANIRYHIEELYDNQQRRYDDDEQAVKSMAQLHEENKLLSEKIEQQFNLQKEMSEKLSNHEAFQTEVIERLENQEALAEKILRKIDHFRSILYERTNFLSEKIGKGYEATSAYMTKFINVNASSKGDEQTKERAKSIE